MIPFRFGFFWLIGREVLEGLTLENEALVAENARAMRELSQDARRRVLPNVNDLRRIAER
jgi:hypothetical protein